MKKTTDPREAAQALQDDKIVKMSLGGRQWTVNAISEGVDAWIAKISHRDFLHSRVETLAIHEFSVYSQAEYRSMIDALRESEENL